MIANGLTLARPRWGVISTHHPAEALSVLERHSALDAIVTELTFDRSADAGRAFIRQVARRWPEIPIFVLSSVDPQDARGLETAELIPKPPDIDFLVARIDRVIRRKRESLVRGIALPTFLQILEIDRKTCTVVVSHGGRVGEIFLRDGKLIHAQMQRTQGKEALFEMLSMPEHSLRVLDNCEAERTITVSLAALLMEWSVREDHSNRPGEAG
jgi:DNA-binding response OmpR family regulator